MKASYLLVTHFIVAITLAAVIELGDASVRSVLGSRKKDKRLKDKKLSSSRKKSGGSLKYGDPIGKKSKRSELCEPTQFKCDDKCIDIFLTCNGVYDCQDESDEAHTLCLALTECGGPMNFKCANGRCISQKWVCDGNNDCAHNDDDLSDESNCGNRTTSSVNINPVLQHCNRETSFICENGKCIPRSFWCDGDKDCTDGSDEKSCPENHCEEVEMFECASGDCIDEKKKCDGIIDCNDGWSDEHACVREHECLRADGKFLCKSNDACLDPIQVCDKKPDCSDHSDEFAGCDQACANVTCHQKCLPDYKTGSGSCYCEPGYEEAKRDNETGRCEDVNECDRFGSCSQACTNLIGTYQCSCINGFRLGFDNKSCEIIDDKVHLVVATSQSIRVLRMGKKEKYYSLVENLGGPIFVTYDAKNNWVYWTDAMEYEETVWRSKLDGSNLEVVVSTGLILPEGIAYDWIADNVYFTDSNKSHVVVCSSRGENCSVIISQGSSDERPRDIALQPNLGILFYTDWGQHNPAVIKASMDGAYVSRIVTENLKWPNGISIDHGNSRIYWIDANTDRIETTDFEGKDRQIVKANGIHHPFGVDVLGDMVFWSDWNIYEVQASNKFNGSNHITLVKESFAQLNGIALVHKANQPITRKNHCQDSGCSHLCTLNSDSSFTCHCPVGFYLDGRNKRICRVHNGWPHFVVAYNNTILVAPVDTIGRYIFKNYTIPELSFISAIAPVPAKNRIFLGDSNKKKIYLYDLNTEKLVEVVSTDVEFIKGIQYDEIGDNLYWVDSEKKTLEIMSMRTKARSILYKEISRPMDIVLARDLRMLFMIEIDAKEGKVVRMNMNGYNRRVLFRKRGIAPISLTYVKESGRLYWTESFHTIRSVGIDGTTEVPLTTGVSNPYGIINVDKKIYWSERHTQLLRGRHLLDSRHSERPIPLFDHLKQSDFYTKGDFFAKLAVLNNDPEHNPKLEVVHDCAPEKNKCSHICVLSTKKTKGVCLCPVSMKLSQDGKTCVDRSTVEVTPSAICVEGLCRTEPTTSSKPTDNSKNQDANESSDNDASTLAPDADAPAWISSPDDTYEESYFLEDYKWGDEGKFTGSKGFERSMRRLDGLEYDEYEGGLSSKVVILPGGKRINTAASPVQQEATVKEDSISSSETHPMIIVLGVFIILVLVGGVIGIVLHRRNVQPRVLVRPYVQQWVKYVNEPVQRFFDRGGDNVDSKKTAASNIYDEVYPSKDHVYTNSQYEDIDTIGDASVNVYSEPDDAHRISYKATQRLLEP